MRAAVIGASGIGKHHAKWLSKHGCSVEAIVGSSEQSAQATRDRLRETLGIAPAAYADAGQMLSEVKPEVVVVATPPSLHERFVKLSLAAGCNTLCEKPPIWDTAPPLRLCTCLDELYALADANARSLLFVGQYRSLCPYVERPEHSFRMRFEVRRPRPLDELWVDLAFHFLVLLTTARQPGTLQFEQGSLSVDSELENGAEVSLVLTTQPEGGTIKTGLQLVSGCQNPQRWIEFDGQRTAVGGRNVDGEYHTLLTRQDGDESVIEDLLKQETAEVLSIFRSGNDEAYAARRRAERDAFRLLAATFEELNKAISS